MSKRNHRNETIIIESEFAPKGMFHLFILGFYLRMGTTITHLYVERYEPTEKFISWEKERPLAAGLVFNNQEETGCRS